MIILIMIFVIVLLVLLAIAGLNSYKSVFETIGIISCALGIIAGILTFCMIFVAISVRVPIIRKQKLVEYEQSYYTITQMIGNNNNDVVTLTNHVAQYNADVLKGRMMQDSKLFSVFDYDFYYDLPLIELNSEDNENEVQYIRWGIR